MTRMIKVAMDLLYKPGSSITQLVFMLLVNQTQLDDGISSLLQIGDEKMQGLYIMKLVRSFCRSSDSGDDAFDHVFHSCKHLKGRNREKNGEAFPSGSEVGSGR